MSVPVEAVHFLPHLTPAATHDKQTAPAPSPFLRLICLSPRRPVEEHDQAQDGRRELRELRRPLPPVQPPQPAGGDGPGVPAVGVEGGAGVAGVISSAGGGSNLQESGSGVDEALKIVLNGRGFCWLFTI